MPTAFLTLSVEEHTEMLYCFRYICLYLIIFSFGRNAHRDGLFLLVHHMILHPQLTHCRQRTSFSRLVKIPKGVFRHSQARWFLLVHRRYQRNINATPLRNVFWVLENILFNLTISSLDNALLNGLRAKVFG